MSLLCPKGHRDLLFISGDFPTGVAMNGYKETRVESGYFCESCNVVFDLNDVDEETEDSDPMMLDNFLLGRSAELRSLRECEIEREK